MTQMGGMGGEELVDAIYSDGVFGLANAGTRGSIPIFSIVVILLARRRFKAFRKTGRRPWTRGCCGIMRASRQASCSLMILRVLTVRRFRICSRGRSA